MNKIAEALNRSQSTISREVFATLDNEAIATNKLTTLHKSVMQKRKVVKMTESVTDLIVGCLEQQWSPEQIAGWLNKEGIVSLHHETIYQFILTR